MIKKLRSLIPIKQKKKVSKYFKYFVCLGILTKEIIYNKNTSVFAFQANIYCIILSMILNFDVVVRSNSSPTGWTKNLIKNFIFKILFKVPKSIIVNSYQFKEGGKTTRLSDLLCMLSEIPGIDRLKFVTIAKR